MPEYWSRFRSVGQNIGHDLVQHHCLLIVSPTPAISCVLEDGAAAVVNLLDHRRRRQLTGVRLGVITVQIDAVNSNATYSTAHNSQTNRHVRYLSHRTYAPPPKITIVNIRPPYLTRTLT